MNKITLSLFVLCVLSANVEAQYYSNSPISTYPDLPYNTSVIGQVNNKLVSILDARQGLGVYAYDSGFTKTEKLISVDREMLNRHWLFSKFYNTPKGLLIDVHGKLYLSNGTAAGTKFLEDFGETYHTSFAGQLVSRIVNIEYVDNKIMVTRAGSSTRGYYKDYTIWKIDLGTAGAKLFPNTQGLNVITSSSSNGAPPVAFGFNESKGYSFWEIDLVQNRLNYINRFRGEHSGEDEVEEWLAVSDGVQIRAGLVFCRSGSDGSSLWRLSRDGRLTRLAENCIQIFESNRGDDDRFYFTTHRGFWEGNGYASGNVRLLQIDARQRFNEVCMFDSSAAISMYSGTLLASPVIILNTESGVSKSFPNIERIAGCLKNRVLLKEIDENYETTNVFVFDGRANALYDVKPTPKLFSNSSPVEIGENIVLHSYVRHDLEGDETGYDRYLNRLTLRAGSFMSFLPSVLEILDE